MNFAAPHFFPVKRGFHLKSLVFCTQLPVAYAAVVLQFGSRKKAAEYWQRLIHSILPSGLDEQVLHETSVVPEHTTSLSATLTSDFHMGEVGLFHSPLLFLFFKASKVLAGPGDQLDAEWEMETEPAMGASKKPLTGGWVGSTLSNYGFCYSPIW